MNLFTKTRAALFALALTLTPSLLQAQQAPVRYLSGTVWTGSETLNQYGKLGFAFRADGLAFMADARSKDNDPGTFVRGTWVQNGNIVEIRFADCIYRGTINGGILSGTARFINGQQQAWTFQVQFMPAQPR